jgi:hypothetical protein
MGEDERRGPARIGSASLGGLILAVVFVGVVGACSKVDEAATAQAKQQEAAAEPPTSAAPISAAPRGASIASVSQGRPLECDDFTIGQSQGNVAGETNLIDGLVGGFLERNKGSSRIDKSCREQFPTSATLATCTTHISSQLTKEDSSVELGTYEVQMMSRYYDPDSLSDDSYMKGCMKMKGDWRGIDKNSDAYKAAVRARASAK